MEFEDANQISEDLGLTDVLFECPLCQKSMVIDEAAVGMVVDCPQCTAKVIVPSRYGELLQPSPDFALLQAAQSGNLEALNEAISRGANMDAMTEDGMTALMLASEQGNENVVGKLIAHGANLQTQRPDGQTALKLAERANQFRVLRMLWRSGGHGVK